MRKILVSTTGDKTLVAVEGADIVLIGIASRVEGLQPGEGDTFPLDAEESRRLAELLNSFAEAKLG